jgi:hypothetical protein
MTGRDSYGHVIGMGEKLALALAHDGDDIRGYTMMG